MPGHNTYNVWTTGQEQQLRELYNTMPGKELAKRLGVTLRALWDKASHMGLTRRKTSEVWLPEQIEVLHATYPLLGQDCAPLCHHTRQQTARRAKSCRLHRVWKHRPGPDAERRKYALMALRWCAEHGVRGHDALAWCADVCGCTPQMMALVLPALARDEMKSKSRRKRK